eukprot:EG_transcript_29176
MHQTWRPAAQWSKKEPQRGQQKLEKREFQQTPEHPTWNQAVKQQYKEFPGRNWKWRRVEEQQTLETTTGQEQSTSPWPSQPPHLPFSQKIFNSNHSTTAMDPGNWWPESRGDKDNSSPQPRGQEMGRQVGKTTPPVSHHHPPLRGNIPKKELHQGHGDPFQQGYGSHHYQ